MSSQTALSRREVFRLTGTVAGAATLGAVAPVAGTRAAKRAFAQETDEMMAGSEPRFAYVGAYTRGAPGGWSALADVNHPEGVAVFAVGAGMGDLMLVQTVPSDNPSFVAMHPSEDYLYVLNEIADYEGQEMGSLEAYAIDDESGQLTLINRVAVGSIPAQLVVSPGGDYLAVATYVGGTYELFPINDDGSLSEASSVAQQEGSGPHERQGAPHVHAVAFDPSGEYLAGADLGTDTIKVFTYTDGNLTEVSAAMVA
ncbi:MAG: beta-propeller fold lactonase family protein, partial [Caldilineaceae bacterium]|nr:beta-propeller fold lactonase family protein [Caldilineaceae bacterium]